MKTAVNQANDMDISIYFIVFEVVVYALAAVAIHHAWQRGLHVVWQLIAGMIFGVLLEWATIQQLDAYEYGRFLIMIADVPIVIGVSWGLIIYSARLFSEATTLPAWVRPVLAGLFALNIDLAMDAIAIRLGMWDWGRGLEIDYFGVPWGNFWAWFWVIFAFSMTLHLFSRSDSWVGRWVAPFLAIIGGVVGVLGTNALLVFVLRPAGLYTIAVWTVLIGALLLVLSFRPKVRRAELPKLVAVTLTTYHFYFLLAGLVSGVIFAPPFLLFMSMLMIAAAFWAVR